MRQINSGDKYEGPSLANMLREFKIPFLQNTPKNDFVMFLAQQHGILTRLDSKSIVALYFALGDTKSLNISVEDSIKAFKEDEFTDSGSAVFIIEPEKIKMVTQ